MKVSKVSEYLAFIEEIGIDDYIYRGQNEPYYGIKANGFRPYSGSWDSDKIYNINELTQDFYNHAAKNISREEKEHFLAFCQHFGIPTNLVDFTYSPLIALFFACYGKEKPKFTLQELIHGDTSEDIDKLRNNNDTQMMLIHNLINKLEKCDSSSYAQVYLIKKKNIIDITDFIIKLDNKNFLECIVNDREMRQDLIQRLSTLFMNINSEADIVNCLVKLIDCYKINNADLCGVFTKEEMRKRRLRRSDNLFTYQRKLKKAFSKEILLDLYVYVRNEIENENITIDEDETSYQLDDFEMEYISAKIYVFLLANLIEIFENYGERLILSLDIYFTYQPPNMFERIVSQQGLFIYQPYMYLNDEILNYNILSFQNINPDITIEIENYSEILKELDVLGINLGSIYGDIDNVAKATVNRYKRRKII